MKQWLKEKEHLKMQQALDETKIKSLEMRVEQGDISFRPKGRRREHFWKNYVKSGRQQYMQCI